MNNKFKSILMVIILVLAMSCSVVLSGCSTSLTDVLGTETETGITDVDDVDDSGSIDGDIILDDSIDSDDEDVDDTATDDDEDVDDTATGDDEDVDDTATGDDEDVDDTATGDDKVTDDTTDNKDSVDTDNSSVSLSESEVATIAARTSVIIYTTFEVTTTTVGHNRTETTEDVSYTGSGNIIDLDMETGEAYIMTCYHVIYEDDANTSICDNIKIIPFGYSSMIEAEFVGGDPYKDTAVLKVEANDVLNTGVYQAAEFAESDSAKIGDLALTVGNSNAEGLTATSGIVSVESEEIELYLVDDTTPCEQRYMRIDAATNSGNSGGGIFSDEGKIIGILAAGTDEVVGVSYCIPVSVAYGVVSIIMDEQKNSDGEYYKYLLGIVNSYTDTYATIVDGSITTNYICEVVEIAEDSIANGVLEVDDVLVSVNLSGEEIEIAKYYQLTDLMYTVRADDTLTFTVLRDGEKVVLEAMTPSMDNISILEV